MADSKFKAMMNELSNKSTILHELTIDEQKLLRECLVNMFKDVDQVCQKYNLSIMFAGGSTLGSVRHKAFIPWDDDLDLIMPREDYDKLKSVFEKELGDRYILVAPNYKSKAKARFPKIIKKGTIMKELTDINTDLPCGVFLDIFPIEKIPENKVYQKVKGLWCSALMYASTQAYLYERRCSELEEFMCQTASGKRKFKIKMFIGKICHIIPSWKWFNAVDNAVQYHGRTDLVGIPTGRKHYFGEILPQEVFFPVGYGKFEGVDVPLPNDCDRYLTNLYGDYWKIPPVEKRERHFIVELHI